MVNLYLDSFNSDITMEDAILRGTMETLGYVDACGVVKVSLNLIKSMFLYQTDGECTTHVLKYYVRNNAKFLFNPGMAQMDNIYSFGAIVTDLSSNLMMINQDYLRYLSLKIFGTPQGVDLFINEAELIQDLSNNFLIIMQNNMAILENHDFIYGTNADLSSNNTSSYVFDSSKNAWDTNYTKYSSDTDLTYANICRELLLQIMKMDPVRFSNIVNTSNMQPVPFIVGDSINFKITVNAAETQNDVTGVNPIPPRIYQIKLLIVDLVQPIAYVLYTNSVNIPCITFQNTESLASYDYVLFSYSIYQENRSITGLLQVYPAAFVNSSSQFSLTNEINGNTNYEITGLNGRMFYALNIVNINLMSELVYITCSSNSLIFNFIQNSFDYKLQVELLNPGKMLFEDITTKNFDINLI